MLLELKLCETLSALKMKTTFLKNSKSSKSFWTLPIQIAESSWSKLLCYHKNLIAQNI